MDELHEAPSVVMYVLAITLVLIIGLTLSVFVFDAVAFVKKWNNLCMLEVGKEYAKYGFSYTVHLEMEPGEFINETHYMAYIRPDYNDDIPKPKFAQKFGFGFYVPYKWADPGEVVLVSNNITTKAYPDEVPNGFYPIPQRECPSLAYLNFVSSGTFGGSYLGDAGFLYYASLVPISVKTEDDDATALTTLPTKSIVYVRFYPGDYFGQVKMQRIGVVQIGKIPGNIKDYTKWFVNNYPYTPYLTKIDPNNNLIVWWGENGKPEYVYYTIPPKK
jgi:hypothetical protein